MEEITLASREFEFNDYSIEPLEIDEDPTGLLRGGVGSTIWDAAIVLSKYLECSDILKLTTSLATPGSPPLNILELGSGTGYVGLVAARILSTKGFQGSKVVLTDKDNVVPLLQRNVEKNASAGIDIKPRILDWETVSGIKAKVEISSTKTEEDGSSNSAQSTKTQLNNNNETKSSTATSGTIADVQDLLSIEWDIVILSDCIWVPALYEPLIGTINALIKPESKTQLLISFEKRNFSEEMEFFALLGKTFRFRDIKPEEQDPNYQSEDIFLFLCQRRTHLEQSKK
ncbi:Methyltransferase-like protein 21D [Haplosporangium sp. Z 27]|nr:Methyltransferase-like protein 21D [Haplosporangium sp. Z 27]